MAIKTKIVDKVKYFYFKFDRNAPLIELLIAFIDSIKKKYEGRLNTLLEPTCCEVEEPVHFDVGTFKFTKSVVLFTEPSDKDGSFSSCNESFFATIDEKFSALITYDAKSQKAMMAEFVAQIYDSFPPASPERAACSMAKPRFG